MNNDHEANANPFPATRWSLIQEARVKSEGLEQWTEVYWKPAMEYYRALGCDQSEAEESVQDFFHQLLDRGPDAVLPEVQKGSFRGFLKKALKNFLIDQKRRQNAIKRGGGVTHQQLDSNVLNTELGSPDEEFDRAWMLQVLSQAMKKLKAESDRAGQTEFFEAVAPLLDGRTHDRAEILERLGMSDVAFRGALHRLRKRFRNLIYAEIRETISSESDYQDELRYFLQLWSK